jgi:hypothetical protein
MRILSEASDLNICAGVWKKKVEWWLGMGQRSFMSLLDLQLPDSQSRLACKVRALSVCYYLQICWLFCFCFRREMYIGSGSSSKVPLQVTTYLILREMVHGCIFPAVGKYLVSHHMRTPIFLERLAISLIRYDQRNLPNRRQIFFTRPTGAQTKSESVGVRMTSHLFTACFLFKNRQENRMESRKVQPGSTSFKLIWHNFWRI